MKPFEENTVISTAQVVETASQNPMTDTETNKNRINAYLVGGVGAGIIAGGVATYFAMHKDDDSNEPVIVDENESATASAAQETASANATQEAAAQTAAADATAQATATATVVVAEDEPATYVTDDEGYFIQTENGSIAYVHPIVDHDGDVVLRIDLNLDGTYDVEVYPGYEGSEPRVLAGMSNVEFDDAGHVVYSAQPADNALVYNLDGEVIQGGEQLNAVVPAAPAPVAETHVVVDEVIVIDEVPDTTADTYETEPDDNFVADNHDVVTTDDTDIYVAENTSPDGMDDFVNDANVDFLA